MASDRENGQIVGTKRDGRLCVAHFPPPDARAKYDAWVAANVDIYGSRDDWLVDIGRAAGGKDFLSVWVPDDASGEKRYLRARWRESPGPDKDWGHSTLLYAVQPDGSVTEQYEIYDNGTILHYNAVHPEDEFGGLSEPLDQQAIDTALREFAGEFISVTDYQAFVGSLLPTNHE